MLTTISAAPLVETARGDDVRDDVVLGRKVVVLVADAATQATLRTWCEDNGFDLGAGFGGERRDPSRSAPARLSESKEFEFHLTLFATQGPSSLADLDTPVEPLLAAPSGFDAFGLDADTPVLKVALNDDLDALREVWLSMAGASGDSSAPSKNAPTYAEFRPHVSLSYAWSGTPELENLEIPNMLLGFDRLSVRTLKDQPKAARPGRGELGGELDDNTAGVGTYVNLAGFDLDEASETADLLREIIASGIDHIYHGGLESLQRDPVFQLNLLKDHRNEFVDYIRAGEAHMNAAVASGDAGYIESASILVRDAGDGMAQINAWIAEFTPAVAQFSADRQELARRRQASLSGDDTKSGRAPGGRKELLSTLALIAAGVAGFTIIDDWTGGRITGGVADIYAWCTDERYRVASRIDAVEAKIEEALVVGEGMRAMGLLEDELARLEARLADLEKIHGSLDEGDDA